MLNGYVYTHTEMSDDWFGNWSSISSGKSKTPESLFKLSRTFGTRGAIFYKGTQKLAN